MDPKKMTAVIVGTGSTSYQASNASVKYFAIDEFSFEEESFNGQIKAFEDQVKAFRDQIPTEIEYYLTRLQTRDMLNCDDNNLHKTFDLPDKMEWSRKLLDEDSVKPLKAGNSHAHLGFLL